MNNNLPEQKELIRRLRESYKEKDLSLNKIVNLMPEDSRKVGRSTCQRLFNRSDAENLNFDYGTLILLSEILLDSDAEDDNARLKYKKSIIEILEAKVSDQQKDIDFRNSRIEKLDGIIADLRQQNSRLTELLNKLVERCDNCHLNK